MRRRQRSPAPLRLYLQKQEASVATDLADVKSSLLADWRELQLQCYLPGLPDRAPGTEQCAILFLRIPGPAVLCFLPDACRAAENVFVYIFVEAYQQNIPNFHGRGS